MTEPQFYNRRRWIYAALVIAILILTALNFWSWFFVQDLEIRQLGETRRQLTSLTRLLAGQLSSNYFLDEVALPESTSPQVIAIERQLFDFKNRADIAAILLVSFDQQTYLDHRFETDDKSRSRSFPINQALFQKALQSDSTYADLRLLGEEYFLTAYAPVSNFAGEALGILIVDAPAGVFSGLTLFKGRLLAIGIGGVLLIALFGGIIILATRRLFDSESRLRRQERLAQLGQMAAMVAHEIRNPLSIIKGSADVLKKKYAGENNELFDFIPEEIDRLNRLVSDFLQFARQKELPGEPLDPARLIGDLVSRINDPRIRFESPPDSAAIPLNKDAFQQVVLNLLENARKATPPEGQIEVICKKGRTYRISLRDSGEGMSAEVLGKAFDPFYTTRATGSGLGLAITRQLVEQMNGAIHLDSSPGQGTTAILEFPA